MSEPTDVDSPGFEALAAMVTIYLSRDPYEQALEVMSDVDKQELAKQAVVLVGNIIGGIALASNADPLETWQRFAIAFQQQGR